MRSQPTVCPACHGDKALEQISFPHYSVFICSECDLTFGVPDVPVGNSSFDGYPWTREWTQNFASHVEKALYSLTKKVDTVAELTGTSVRSMLDVGSGNGAFLAAAEKAGISAEGTDIDAEHVGFAQVQGLKVFYGDISDYDTDRQYDFVHVKESFHLVTETKAFVERIATLMHGNSVLYVDSTHGDGLASRYRKLFVKPPRYGQLYPPLHNRTFNRKSLSLVLERAGFKIIRLFTFSKGNRIYCPTRHLSLRQCTINPCLDMLFLGGFIGCYAMKRAG